MNRCGCLYNSETAASIRIFRRVYSNSRMQEFYLLSNFVLFFPALLHLMDQAIINPDMSRCQLCYMNCSSGSVALNFFFFPHQRPRLFFRTQAMFFFYCESKSFSLTCTISCNTLVLVLPHLELKGKFCQKRYIDVHSAPQVDTQARALSNSSLSFCLSFYFLRPPFKTFKLFFLYWYGCFFLII